MAGTEETIWERWHEVDRLLAEALDLDPDAQEHLFASREVHDPELVGTVRSLLAGSRLAEERLCRAAQAALEAAVSGDLDTCRSALRPGERVGRYTVVEELGRGGMATVYLAERSDGTFIQRVALKVLRRGLDTEEIVRRFVAERQILSSMSHPNIARLLDGGATDDGRPYLVMERVEGEPITDWADHHDATVRQRLELLLQVSGAVQFAHSHLVVHRDLKPSNVLVDKDGQVKLLDFGIAKLLGAADELGAGLTRTGTPLPLTPEYASPEQLLGERVTTASDVFQLGELLYVLLTGRRPFARNGLAFDPGWVTDDPIRPSAWLAPGSDPPGWHPPKDGVSADQSPAAIARARGTTPEALRRRLKGDLGLILLKALRREPDRRYGSVEQLADDVRRYVEGRPILARPDSVPYRTMKFVRRHPAGVTSALVSVALILSFGVVAVVQARRIAAERDRVRIEAAKSAQVRDFLTSLFTVSEPNRAQGETITARELLDSGAVRVRRELAGQPDLEAQMLATIGRVYARLGMYDRARPLLEDAVALHDATPSGTVTDEIEALRELAIVVWRSDFDRGEQLYRRALALAEDAYGPESPVVADLLTGLAPRLSTGFEVKDQMMARAVEILRKAPGDHRAQLAAALAVQGYGLGGTEEAIALQREALAIRRELYGDVHTDVAASLSDLALTLEATDPMASDSLLTKSLAISLELLGERHTATMTRMNNLAGVRRDRGDYAGAESLYRKVLRLRREVYPDEWHRAYPLHGLGWVLTEQGRADEAEPYLLESLRLLEDHLPSDHALIDIARSTLGRCLAGQGRYEEAETLLVGAFDRTRGRVNPQTATVLRDRVVDLYDSWGRPEEGRRFMISALESTGR